MKKALQALNELEGTVDTLLVIEDQKLIEITPEDLSYEEAFHIADDMLYQAVRGITSIIFRVGMVNVDFADLRKTIEHGGRAIMGSATGSGENAVMEAVEKAINNPLLKDGTMINARNILAYFTGRAERMSLRRIEEAVNYIKELTNTEDAEHEVIFGIGDFPYGENPPYDVEVTIIATSGREERESVQQDDFAQEESHLHPIHEEPSQSAKHNEKKRIPAIFKRKHQKDKS